MRDERQLQRMKQVASRINTLFRTLQQARQTSRWLGGGFRTSALARKEKVVDRLAWV